MGIITRIAAVPSKKRVYVYIDGEYAASIRERTFPAMHLAVGDEITAEELQEKDNFFWKKAYGPSSWEAEKLRLRAVEALLKGFGDKIGIECIGFGTESLKLIPQHPSESGGPDLALFLEPVHVLFGTVEVTGTGRRRGTDYWVRPDKLRYAQNHPELPDWIVLHYDLPEELFVFLRPKRGVTYQEVSKVIRVATERYVVFDEKSPETRTLQQFRTEVLTAMEAASARLHDGNP